MEQTLYSEPTPEQILEASYQKKKYLPIYHNGKLNHWQLVKIPEVKAPCLWCGRNK
jgi:hypothetical protein